MPALPGFRFADILPNARRADSILHRPGCASPYSAPPGPRGRAIPDRRPRQAVIIGFQISGDKPTRQDAIRLDVGIGDGVAIQPAPLDQSRARCRSNPDFTECSRRSDLSAPATDWASDPTFATCAGPVWQLPSQQDRYAHKRPGSQPSPKSNSPSPDRSHRIASSLFPSLSASSAIICVGDPARTKTPSPRATPPNSHIGANRIKTVLDDRF